MVPRIQHVSFYGTFSLIPGILVYFVLGLSILDTNVILPLGLSYIVYISGFIVLSGLPLYVSKLSIFDWILHVPLKIICKSSNSSYFVLRNCLKVEVQTVPILDITCDLTNINFNVANYQYQSPTRHTINSVSSIIQYHCSTIYKVRNY